VDSGNNREIHRMGIARWMVSLIVHPSRFGISFGFCVDTLTALRTISSDDSLEFVNSFASFIKRDLSRIRICPWLAMVHQKGEVTLSDDS
jgi:hypothetical protein